MKETQSGSAQNTATATENPAEQIKIFSKQKAQTQTKSKQSLSSSLVYADETACTELFSGFAVAGRLQNL